VTGTGRLFLIAAAAYLYLPIAVLCLFAFHEGEVMAFPFRGPTLGWFSALAGNRPFIDGLLNSLAVALPVGALSAAFGLAGALALQGALQARSRASAIVLGLLLVLPFLIPRTVLGVAQAMVVAQLGLGRGPLVLILAHTLVALPFTTALLASALAGIDPRLEEAARDLGASARQRFRLVLFPLLRNVFFAAMSVGTILSLADVTLAQFLAGRAQTLSLVVASRFLREMKPDINAVQVIMLGITALLTVLAIVLRNRRQSAGRARPRPERTA
jgi:spermidine/putrescine transport system permease protein